MDDVVRVAEGQVLPGGFAYACIAACRSTWRPGGVDKSELRMILTPGLGKLATPVGRPVVDDDDFPRLFALLNGEGAQLLLQPR